ncbi:transposase IS4 family protein [Bathymodiolus heckerae thiotrophic gill symbiont]|uniref:IS1182 family transposase n=1 Tax=Bathymodiolus heckerae thiotrophic gill symbiont TaxID=1052212 RepID=UPI0010B6E8DD|nr:IS1182 family transposase [Bathymodiolus heckerae thiotrophic gill symbiont]SHN92378.1 transposase IS4 family protein [Bathymodiolus heckerae thiotrophic gill symbiont]
MTIPFKSPPVEFRQHQLFPSNIFDLLADEHECYLYNDLFQQLDTSSLESHYKHNGQNAYHPKQIVSILIYAYSRGVFSSREIQRRCTEDLSFMYIAQMNCPNFRVLSDFRKNNSAFFHNCFKQTVQLAIELKLASLGHISLDGSKFQANSSKHKAMSYGRMKEKEQALSQEIDALIEKASRSDKEEDQAYKDQTGYEIPEDLKHKQARLEQIKAAKTALEVREEKCNPGQVIDDKKQISFADKEARIMGKKGSFDYQYNVQISVDEDRQIIVGQHLSQNANDKQEIEPALVAIKEATGTLPDKLSADNGYMSGDNLQALKESPINTYIATDKGEKKNKDSLENTERKLVKADFDYDESTDTYTCPGQQTLVVVNRGKDGSRTYQGDVEKCNECAYKSRCCQSKKGEARTINTDDKEPLRQQMNSKMEEEESKVIYKQRKVIVEPVFGQIKNTGFRGFSVRGKEKVAGELSLVCATHNIKKIAKAIFKGVVRPEFIKRELNPVI